MSISYTTLLGIIPEIQSTIGCKPTSAASKDHASGRVCGRYEFRQIFFLVSQLVINPMRT